MNFTHVMGKIFKEKMGFQGMIKKMTLKLPRESSVLPERREHARQAAPAVFCAVPEYTSPC